MLVSGVSAARTAAGRAPILHQCLGRHRGRQSREGSRQGLNPVSPPRRGAAGAARERPGAALGVGSNHGASIVKVEPLCRRPVRRLAVFCCRQRRDQPALTNIVKIHGMIGWPALRYSGMTSKCAIPLVRHGFVGVSMAPRAYWKGYLKLSLVSCPIALYPATSSSERVSFNRINKKTGNRLKQQLVDSRERRSRGQGGCRTGLRDRQRTIPAGRRRRDRKRSRSRARTRSISTSFVPRGGDRRPLSGQRHITSRRPTRSARRPSPSSATPSATKAWWRWAYRADAPRARHHARSLRQGTAWRPRLRYSYEVRDQGGLFRGCARAEAAGRDEGPGRPHHRQQGQRISIPQKFDDHYETALVELLRARSRPAQVHRAVPKASRRRSASST